MEELVSSSRLAASWIQNNRVDRGIAVISFYGISGSNSDSNKRRANERYLTALWRYLAHHKQTQIFICMDANVHMEKSEVLQAMKVARWRDAPDGLGDPFRSGFKEKLEDDTVRWTKSGEEIFREINAPAGSAVQENQIHSI